MIENICKNCGHLFEGKFCNNCGEKVYTNHDRSMRHFFGEILHFFSHLDNKFFRTLLLIFRKPGLLSATYCNGIRNRYYQPISLFFIGVALYLLFPFFQGLNLSFGASVTDFKLQHMLFIEKLAVHKANAAHLGIQQLAEKYDYKSPAFAKIFLLILIPLTAVALKILFPKKRKYFFDYLILGTEWNSILLYCFFLFIPFLLMLVESVLTFFHSGIMVGDRILFPLYTGFIMVWTIYAFMRFFEISFTRALAKGFLFLFFQVIIIIIYRLVLFLTVLLFI